MEKKLNFSGDSVNHFCIDLLSQGGWREQSYDTSDKEAGRNFFPGNIAGSTAQLLAH